MESECGMKTIRITTKRGDKGRTLTNERLSEETKTRYHIGKEGLEDENENEKTKRGVEARATTNNLSKKNKGKTDQVTSRSDRVVQEKTREC